MDDLTCVAADAAPPEMVWRAFVDGFRGYVRPFDLDFAPFMAMIQSEDVDLCASVVAIAPGGEPAGVALLAIREDACWCGGLGVTPSQRRRGLGRRLMEILIEGARTRGFPRMRLECIDGNLAARALYDNLGYRALRRLDAFEGNAAVARYPDMRRGPSVEFTDPELVWADFGGYHPVAPPWQSDERACRAGAATGPLVGLGLGDSDRPQAYALARIGAPDTAPIVLRDAGVLATAADPIGDLTELLARLLAEYPVRPVVAANIPDRAALNAALRHFGIPVTLTQTEMALDL